MKMSVEQNTSQEIGKEASSKRHLPAQNTVIVLLTWAGGCFDAICYLNLRVFPTVMTGNTVLLGISLVTGAYENAFRSIAAVGGYCLGVFIATLLLAYDDACTPWTRRLTITIFMETITIALFTLVRFLSATPPRDTVNMLMLDVLACLATGMQSVITLHLGVAGISTTYITGTLTNFMMGITQWIRPRSATKVPGNLQANLPQLEMQAWVWPIYVVSAFIGAFTVIHLPYFAPFLPLSAVGLVLYEAIRHQRVRE